MGRLNFMQRRKSGRYEFRQRLPQSLAGRVAPPAARAAVPELINPTNGMFKREVVQSLKTADYATAKRLNHKAALRFGSMFALAAQLLDEAAPKPPAPAISVGLPDPAEIEQDFLRKILEADEEEREQGDPRRHLQTKAERSQWPDLADARIGKLGMAAGHLEMLDDINAELLEDLKKAFARRDTDIIKAELHGYLTQNRLPVEPGSEFYRKASLAALKGSMKGHEEIAKRQAGEDVPTPKAVIREQGPKLSEAFALWKAGSPARGGKRVAITTANEAERAVRYLTEWAGDIRLGIFTKEQAREFRNALARMPTRLSREQRKLPLRQLIASNKAGQELIVAASVNKYLNLLSAVVTANEREGALDGIPGGYKNPFEKLNFIEDKRDEGQKRKPFLEADLTKLFKTPVFQLGKRPLGGGLEAAFWLPLLALLSGARLNELAQLRVCDIRQDADTSIWVLDIGTDGGRSIKTASSRREVPVHQELIRLGILRYREARLEAAGSETATLWPALKSTDPEYRAAMWSKWFGRYIRSVAKIEDRGLVFHSFRHSFKRMARDAGIQEDLSDRLSGHVGVGSVGRAYGAGFSLKPLHEAINRIEAPAVVKELADWQPTVQAPAKRKLKVPKRRKREVTTRRGC